MIVNRHAVMKPLPGYNDVWTVDVRGHAARVVDIHIKNYVHSDSTDIVVGYLATEYDDNPVASTLITVELVRSTNVLQVLDMGDFLKAGEGLDAIFARTLPTVK